MRFPISLKAAEQMVEAIKKRPDSDFLLEFRTDRGVLVQADLVYVVFDAEMMKSVEAHISLDIP